jgi:hypothetical protein
VILTVVLVILMPVLKQRYFMSGLNDHLAGVCRQAKRSPKERSDGVQDIAVERAADLAEQRERGVRVAEEWP